MTDHNHDDRYEGKIGCGWFVLAIGLFGGIISLMSLISEGREGNDPDSLREDISALETQVAER